MLPEGHLVLGPDQGVLGAEAADGACRDVDVVSLAGGRAELEQLGVEALDFGGGGPGEPGDYPEVEGLVHGDGVVLEGREDFEVIESVALGVFGDDGGGDHLGQVVAGLELQGLLLAQAPIVGAAGMAELLVNLGLAGVVGCRGQVPVAAEKVVEVGKIIEGGAGALDRIVALVHPEIDVEPELLAGGADELPQSAGAGIAVDGGVEIALDPAQVKQLFRHAPFLELGIDHVLIQARADHGPLKAPAAGPGEKSDVGRNVFVDLKGKIAQGLDLLGGDVS